MERTETTLTLKKDLGITTETLYTVPANTKTTITGINVCNKDSKETLITLSVQRSGTNYTIFSEVPIAANDIINFSGHIVLDTASDLIVGSTNKLSSIDVIISGWESV